MNRRDSGPSSIRSIALVIAAAASIAGPAACGSDREGVAVKPVERTFFGINGQFLRPLAAHPDTVELLDRQLQSIENLDISFVRANLDWRVAEPLRGQYDFAALDSWVAALARHRLTWQVLGQGAPTPAWAATPSDLAACGSRARPANPEDFSRFMKRVTSRYGAHGSFWKENPKLPYRPTREYEIWNEPNFGSFWCPAPDPAAYGQLLAETSRAIREVDPSARILLGGLAYFAPPPEPDPVRMQAGTFLDQLARAQPNLSEIVDQVAVHIYGADGSAAIDELSQYRSEIDAIGLQDTPIAITEVGWFTSGQSAALPAVSDDQRGEYLATLASAAALGDCSVASLAPHTWYTQQLDPNNPEDWFGLADPATAEPYASAKTYAAAASEMEAGMLPSSAESSVLDSCAPSD